MSTKIAVTTFNETVETKMRRNGDLAAACLCRDKRLVERGRFARDYGTRENKNVNALKKKTTFGKQI